MDCSVTVVTILLMFILCITSASHHRYKRIVGGKEASAPSSSSSGDPTIFVYKDDREAVIIGTKTSSGQFAFRGIRYAEPPVEKYRFQRPRKLHLQGQIQAQQFGSPCPQPDPSGDGKVIGSEDCLFLNVFIPKMPSAEDESGLPVLVWIHGGGFRRGSASQYDPRPLVKKGIIVVTIQYRLGSLGFLSSASRDLPGNAGMFDMMQALNWVKDYISYFGGNPKHVMAFGQGTGASSAFFLAISRITQGYLSGLVAMSGSALSSFAIDHNPLATAKDIAKRNNCPEEPSFDMITCLQQLPVENLIKADSALEAFRLAAQGFMAGITGILGAAPVVEGPNDGRALPGFLEKSPQESFKLGDFPDIPLLSGITKDETSTALNGKYLQEILEKSSTSPDFWDDVLKDLTRYSGVGLFSNVTNEWLDTWSTGYRSLLIGSSTEAGDKTVPQLIEATSDALFNVQAFESVNMWSKKAPSYLYSFDHKSNTKGSSQFLKGLPLVDQGENTATDSSNVGHGDDLSYLFDVGPLEGGNETGRSLIDTEEDRDVQDVYTDMISNFVLKSSPLPSSNFNWPTFREQTSSYFSVSSNPTVNSQFRYCEMALWTGITSRLQSSTCQAIKGVEQLTENFSGVVSGIANPVKNISGSVSGIANPVKNISGSLGSVFKPPFGGSFNSIVNPLSNNNVNQSSTSTTNTPKTESITTSSEKITKTSESKITSNATITSIPRTTSPVTTSRPKTTQKILPVNIPNLNPFRPFGS